MFIHYRTQGIILKKEDRGETNQLFTIYTKDFGKLEITGKAIRKTSSKLRSGAEIFYLSEVEFIQGKAQKTLTDAILIDKFKNLRKDLKRLKVAYKISEVSDNLIKEQEPDEKIWNLFNEVFQRLNVEKQKSLTQDLTYHYFLWNLLSILGYQLELHRCALCQKKLSPEDIYFSPREGGLICGQCGKPIKSAKKIDSNTIKIIRILIKQDWPTLKRLKVEAKDLKTLNTISSHYLTEILKEVE
jgi:DNA repair protein RecO (recombination protein O)